MPKPCQLLTGILVTSASGNPAPAYRGSVASKTGHNFSLRTWANQRKASSLQHVHTCAAPGHVWERMALIPPFLGSCGSFVYDQPPQEAMLFLIIHPKVIQPGLGPLSEFLSLGCRESSLSS